jgi:hypothetical protein
VSFFSFCSFPVLYFFFNLFICSFIYLFILCFFLFIFIYLLVLKGFTKCGNGLVEVGEECDCGLNCVGNSCCDSACKLIPPVCCLFLVRSCLFFLIFVSFADLLSSFYLMFLVMFSFFFLSFSFRRCVTILMEIVVSRVSLKQEVCVCLLYLFIYLFIYQLFIYLFIYLYIYLIMYLHFESLGTACGNIYTTAVPAPSWFVLFIYYLFVCLYIFLFIYLFINFPISLFIVVYLTFNLFII